MTEFEINELRHLLLKAMKNLDERERIVLTEYYFGGLSLSEIGLRHSCTYTRITKIRDKGLLKLSKLSLTRELITNSV